MSLQAAFCNKPDAKAALCAIKSNISLVERQAISDNLKADSSVSDQGKEGFIYDFPIFFLKKLQVHSKLYFDKDTVSPFL